MEFDEFLPTAVFEEMMVEPTVQKAPCLCHKVPIDNVAIEL
jgi:hypothetical protein